MEQKKLGFWDLMGLAMGGTIGAAIFVMLGTGIALTGRSIVIASGIGVIAMMIAYIYHLIMSSMFVFEGGGYGMTSIAMGPILTGTNSIFVFLGGSAMAIQGTAMVEYLGMIFPGILPYSKIVAIGIMTFMFIATIRGSKFTALINLVMMVTVIVAVTVFIALGIPNVESGYFTGDDFLTNGLTGLFAAYSMMAFACQGTSNGPIAVAAVAKNPKRNVPLAIIAASVVMAFVYGLMAIVAAGVLPIEEVANQSLAVVAMEFLPNWAWILFVLGGAVMAIGTTALSSIASLRYPLTKVANDGWLPKVFTKTTKGGYPWVIMLLFYLTSTVPIALGFSLEALVSLIMVPMMVTATYMNLYLMKCVKTYPEQWKRSILHMPYPILCVLSILAAILDLAIMVTILAMLSFVEMLMVLAAVAICVVVAYIRIKQGAVDTNFREKSCDELKAQLALED